LGAEGWSQQEVLAALAAQQLSMGQAIGSLAEGQQKLMAAVENLHVLRDRHPLSLPPTPLSAAPTPLCVGPSPLSPAHSPIDVTAMGAPGTPFAHPQGGTASGFPAPPFQPPFQPPVQPAPSLKELEDATARGVNLALMEQEKRRAATHKTMKALPADLTKLMDKAAKTFTDDARRHQRALARAERAESKEKFFNDMESQGKYPPGVKPFNLSAAAVEFDSAGYGPAEHENAAHAFTVSKGSTLRQAWAEIHFQYTRYRETIELMAAREFSKTTKEKASKQACRTSMVEVVTKYVDDIAEKQKLSVSLGIEQPEVQLPELPQQLITDKADTIFKDTAAKLDAEVKKKEQAEKLAKEKEQKVQEELTAPKPAGLLNDAIDRRIAALTGSNVAGAGEPTIAAEPPMADLGAAAEGHEAGAGAQAEQPDSAELFVNSLQQKNGETPGAAPGQNVTVDNKNKSPKDKSVAKKGKKKKSKTGGGQPAAKGGKHPRGDRAAARPPAAGRASPSTPSPAAPTPTPTASNSARPGGGGRQGGHQRAGQNRSWQSGWWGSAWNNGWYRNGGYDKKHGR